MIAPQTSLSSAEISVHRESRPHQLRELLHRPSTVCHLSTRLRSLRLSPRSLLHLLKPMTGRKRKENNRCHRIRQVSCCQGKRTGAEIECPNLIERSELSQTRTSTLRGTEISNRLFMPPKFTKMDPIRIERAECFGNGWDSSTFCELVLCNGAVRTNRLASVR